MIKRNRLITSALAMAVVFVMLVSVCLIALEADHDCHGEDCPICEQISLCENTIRLGGIAAATALFFGLTVGSIGLLLLSANESFNRHSLITLKVKHSD